MARYATTTTPERVPPAEWPAWVLLRPPGGYVPGDAGANRARSKAVAALRARQRAWRQEHTTLGLREFDELARAEAARRRLSPKHDDNTPGLPSS